MGLSFVKMGPSHATTKDPAAARKAYDDAIATTKRAREAYFQAKKDFYKANDRIGNADADDTCIDACNAWKAAREEETRARLEDAVAQGVSWSDQ